MTQKQPPLWPSRQQWAADAERFVRTLCHPTERVPSDPAHWLTGAELTELRDELAETVKAARREIGRAKHADPDRVTQLKSDRSALNAAAREVRNQRARVDDVLFGTDGVLRVARRHVDDATPAMHRLGVLRGVLATRRDRAADEALRTAITREVARRTTDAGWAKELERRRRIAQPTLTVIDTITQR
ncbi:hypothetical protein [Streptomonospora litoralis]|uniref:Uncharacterized protein n=1 Tax=Streptomonospora litoralis TaxID=2498135 RepID=A0A4P6QBK8_9ACTN|nr:hypothetical protein [Streptomonospora litoralis]QBI56857.1 hypothetical protein EKD16_25585 [Streptomonospora litoralis]